MAKKSAKKGGAKKAPAWKPPKVSAASGPRKKSELYGLLGESVEIAASRSRTQCLRGDFVPRRSGSRGLLDGHVHILPHSSAEPRTFR